MPACLVEKKEQEKPRRTIKEKKERIKMKRARRGAHAPVLSNKQEQEKSRKAIEEKKMRRARRGARAPVLLKETSRLVMLPQSFLAMVPEGHMPPARMCMRMISTRNHDISACMCMRMISTRTCACPCA